jgi:hypothetical protein
MHQKIRNVRLEWFWALRKVQNEANSNGTSRSAHGEVQGTQTQRQGSKYARIGTTQSVKRKRIGGGGWEIGQESE